MDNLGKQQIKWGMQQFLRFFDECEYSTKDDPTIWCPSRTLRYHYKEWIEDQSLFRPGTTLLANPISKTKMNYILSDILGYRQTRRRDAQYRLVTGWARLHGPGSLQTRYGRPPVRLSDDLSDTPEQCPNCQIALHEAECLKCGQIYI